jgi:AbrB family looped-hinge helix DNA binding protein
MSYRRKECEAMAIPIIDNAKVLPKGQITIPKDIRDYLKINVGDRLTLVCENDRLVLMNSAMFALKEFQKAMVGEAEKAGLYSDEDVAELIMQTRRGKEI